MTRLLRIFALVLGLVVFGIGVASAKLLHLGIDMSASVPITVSDAYAERAAANFRDRIAALENGDKVELHFFGAYGLAATLQRIDLTISRRNSARRVADTIYALVAGIPKLVREQKIKVQDETNIIGHLQDHAPLLNCAGGTAIVLLTDGIEWSSLVNGKLFFEGKAKLPKAREGLLKGCNTLTFLGIGQIVQGANPKLTSRLESEWRRWATEAGVAKFEAFPTF